MENISGRRSPSLKGLAKKICQVMGECENLPKNGYNEFHRYHYVMESDVVNGMRAILAKNGLCILPELVRHEIVEKQGKDGKLRRLSEVEIDYLLIDSDSDEFKIIKQLGYGVDGEEKGFYKAITGCHKYFLQKTFNISSGEESTDPENESLPSKDHKKTAPAKTKQTDGSPKFSITEPQRKRLFAIARTANWPETEIKVELKRAYGIDSTSELTQKQYEEVCGFIELNPRDKRTDKFFDEK